MLEAEIQAGRSVAVGWLHHGPATAPTGGGHWSVVIGCTETVAIHHDPNGEAAIGGIGLLHRHHAALLLAGCPPAVPIAPRC